MNATILNEVSADKILIVVAMEEEAAGFVNDFRTIFTGVGKLNASYHLMKAIMNNRPELIINIGSAGSNIFPKETLVSCSQFIQRDMDATGLGFDPFKTPFSETPIILNTNNNWEGLPQGICGSGDQFVTAHGGELFNVIDMEGYALADISLRENIPFYCVKFISDGADGTAASDWSEMVHKAGRRFGELLGLL